MTAEMSAFLREGLIRYPEAKAAVSEFEARIGDMIIQILATMKPPIGVTAWRPKLEHPMSDAQGLWIWSRIGATIGGEPVVLTAGLWWSKQVGDDVSRPFVYSGYDYDRCQSLRGVELDRLESGCELARSPDPVLRSPVGEDLENLSVLLPPQVEVLTNALLRWRAHPSDRTAQS